MANTKKVMVAMSGGVDSSVTACLLQKQGYDIVGATMKLFQNGDVDVQKEKACCSLDDVEDARAVCARLGVPHYVLNMTADFEKEVMERFVRAYEQGFTPNPCIDCNRYMKFERLLHKALTLEMDYVATGHYARIEKQGDRLVLKKAKDLHKDQSYVLYSLTREQLAHTLFPLGGLTKPEVREIAAENGFVNLHHINIRKSAYASRTKFHNKCFKPTAKCLYFDGLCDGTYQKAIMVNFLILYACARVAYKREYAPAWEELLYMMSFTKMFIVSRRLHCVGTALCSNAKISLNIRLECLRWGKNLNIHKGEWSNALAAEMASGVIAAPDSSMAISCTRSSLERQRICVSVRSSVSCLYTL